jgi:cation-transporting ATPase E
MDAKPTEIEGQEKIKRLMFAYSPLTQPIYVEGHYPQCPQDLIPLCYIKFIDEVRPEVLNTVKFFKEEDISLKILTEAEPANTLVMAHQLGIIESETEDSSLTNGEEISKLAKEDFQRDVINKTIFTKVNSDQMIRVIKALQSQGEHVAVLGTSINDLPMMQTADLSITRKGSSPTVLDQADIIVLKNTFNALTDALQKGQRIVNSVMDVLKLNLTRIAYTLILVVAMYIAGERTFFFHPAQGGMINVFTIILPSIALSFWASAKTIDGKIMPRLLFHFFTPAAVVTSLAVLIINLIFSRSGAGVVYTQLAVTHALILIGLLLTIFVQPPVRFLVAGDDFGSGWQITISALVFFIIFHLITLIPLAQRWFRVAPLQSLWDYLLILLIGIVWAFLVIGIWRLVWPERFMPAKPKSEDGYPREIRDS